jgi:hypothetical protein
LLSDSTHNQISVRAFDFREELIVERLNETNPRIAFTTYDGGMYRFCAENLNAGTVAVNILFKTGVDARDYSLLPDTKDLSPVEIVVNQIAGVVQQIQKELSYVREREEQMRHTNQTIGERVVGYSVLTILMLAGLSVFQVLYLRAFFKAKKIN